MVLKVYADRMSQPSRAVLLFCRLNGIDFEEVRIDLAKRQQFTPEYKAINPMSKVPSIVDGRFKLFESHAILIYLACAFPGVADHCQFILNNLPFMRLEHLALLSYKRVNATRLRYPADLSKRAQINSVLDWHHSNLRSGTVKLVGNTVLAPLMGRPASPEEAAEAAKLLRKSLAKIETYWLKGNGRFLLGSSRPSIADLSLVCEIMQLELLDEKDRDQFLSPHKKTLQWIEDTKNATWAHFDEIHGVLYKAKERFRERRNGHSSTEAGKTTEMRSKM